MESCDVADRSRVIRTSHAARAMSRRETPERRAELALGLAYWASSYEEVAGRGPSVASLDKLPLYWEATGHRPVGGSITDGLRHVKELDAFPARVDIASDRSSATRQARAQPGATLERARRASWRTLPLGLRGTASMRCTRRGSM
jgi:hypothetical protein